MSVGGDRGGGARSAGGGAGRRAWRAWRARRRSRERFGIETSYRQKNQGRGWTTSADPAYRLLLEGVALVLRQVWVALAGEGTFGLQRAFHYAGTKNVVASLWKVDDAATAALMGEFYRQLWEENRPPIEALRQAQLAVYKADGKAFAALAKRGFESGTVDVSKLPVAADSKGGNRPALWAAFTLSGYGR